MPHVRSNGYDGRALPEKAEAYKRLVRVHGEGAVADMLLAKWLRDPDAGDQWTNLAGDIGSVVLEVAA